MNDLDALEKKVAKKANVLQKYASQYSALMIRQTNND